MLVTKAFTATVQWRYVSVIRSQITSDGSFNSLFKLTITKLRIDGRYLKGIDR